MNAPSGTSSSLRGSFEDVHSLGRLANFDLDFRTLSTGVPQVPATLTRGNNAILVDMLLRQALHQRGLPPGGAVTVGIPRSSVSSWFGGQYSRDAILPFNGLDGIDVISGRNFAASVLSMPEAFLLSVADQHKLNVPRALIHPESGSVICRSSHNLRLRQRVLHLINDSAEQLDSDVELELALLLLMAGQPDTLGQPREAASIRTSAVANAFAYIDAHSSEALTVKALCAATGVPARTLSRGFRERFGVGPKAYINRVRLSRVRRALVQAGPEATITDIANQQGFWHMGQFARDYHRLFGELPSQTSANRSSR